MSDVKKKIAFIGSECYPFVKTGGLGDVMFALPKALIKQNCDVRVFLPCYKCIPEKYRDEMKQIGSFEMDLSRDGKQYYVGIKELTMDGVTYLFVDNEDFFSWGKPYTELYDDIPKYCFFSKATLAIMNYLEWIPDVIHCHDWQAGLVPVYVHKLFAGTPVGQAKTVFTIHNLRFQGMCNSEHLLFWSGLSEDVLYDQGAAGDGFNTSNMLKGGLSFADSITTVSNTYAEEIQTAFYGEHLDGHLRYLSHKL
ncbi:MAG: glycogen/starch synthase, partial [Clostridiales bacterium]|nr:glycogen/starch synthase [Candidatus Blautia equi]